MTQALKELGKRKTVSPLAAKPKIITLGGDHSLALPALRALNEIYGKTIQVLHFDGGSIPSIISPSVLANTLNQLILIHGTRTRIPRTGEQHLSTTAPCSG